MYPFWCWYHRRIHRDLLHIKSQFYRKQYTLSVFKAESHTVTVTVHPGGSVVPSGVVQVQPGSPQVFVVTPDPGHAILDIVVDGESLLTGGPVEFGLEITFPTVPQDIPLEVFFLELLKMDFGDAPASYSTLLVDDGARHTIIPGGPFLGISPDGEDDGLPSQDALGDDNNDDNDESSSLYSVIFVGPLMPGSATVSVSPNGLLGVGGHKDLGGFLNAWVDLNIDGDWDDPGEQILTDVEMSSDAKDLDFVVPQWQIGFSRFGKSYARFRISSQAGLSFKGLAPDGEVEDLTVKIYMKEELVMSPSSASNAVGTDHTVTATLYEVYPHGTRKPIGGRDVRFRIYGGPHKDLVSPHTVTTDFDGNVTFTYTGTLPGTDFITAGFSDSWSGYLESTGVEKEWKKLSFAVDTPSLYYESVPVGSQSDKKISLSNTGAAPLEFTATVSGDEDFAIPDFYSDPFVVDSGDTHIIWIDFEPLSEGEKSATLEINSVISELAPVYVGLLGFAAPMDFGEDISLSPSSASNPVGTGHTVTATVYEIYPDGSRKPVVGRTVVFELLGGAHAHLNVALVPHPATTDSNGEATFTYTGGLPGTDIIGARFTDRWGVEHSVQVEKEWKKLSFAVDSPSLYYEFVPVGGQSDKKIGLSNTGVEPMEFTATVSGDEDFAIPDFYSDPFVVDSGDTHIIPVNFTPLSEGEKTATLEIDTVVPELAQVDIELHGTAASMDFGDAPLPYPTLLEDDGARHILVQGGPHFSLGFLGEPDGEADGHSSPDALGDDHDQNADEGGVYFASPLLAGDATARAGVLLQYDGIPDPNVVTNPRKTGFLNAWVDFDMDGTWSDPGEQVFTDVELTSSQNIDLAFKVPAGLLAGTTYARFRISSDGGLSYTGLAGDGEGEEITVKIYMTEEIALIPPSASNPVGTEHTVTAIVHEVYADGSGTKVPVAQRSVWFGIIDGPNASPGQVPVRTDDSGRASYTYSSVLPGTDVVEARFADSWHTEHSVQVEKEWTVLPGDLDGDGQVRPNDAAIILQMVAGLIDADAYDMSVADVNRDGKIGADDAILILRTAAGSEAPSRNYVTSAGGPVTVTMIEAHGVAGDRIKVHVRIEHNRDLSGGEVSIAYDDAVLRAVDASSDSNALMVSNIAEPGLIRIAFAGVGSIASGELAEIQFDVLADDISPLSLQAARLYQPSALPIDSLLVDSLFSSWAIPAEQSTLLQNFPNPFNPETWIPYHLKVDSEVTIRMYSAAGEAVRKLELGHRPAGLYVSRDRAAYWDGRNASGEKVASGIYFYHISTGDFSAVRKMTILK